MVYKNRLIILGIISLSLIFIPFKPSLAGNGCIWGLEQNIEGQYSPACGTGYLATNESQCDGENPGNFMTGDFSCCCPAATAAETESVIGGSLWTNPFDSLQVKVPGLQRFSNPICGSKFCQYSRELCKDDTSCKEGEACVDQGYTSCYVPWIGEYIRGWYNYAVGIGGIVALVIIMMGGLFWLTSGGSPDKINNAKSWIGGAVIGLLLLMGSYFLLSVVNSDLVSLAPTKVDIVESAIQCPQNLAEIDECVACKECTKLNVPVKSGAGNNAHHTLAEKLYAAYQKQTGWQVTEAWPPTVHHTNPCQYNGTCVDVGLNGDLSYNHVKSVYDALTAQGLTLVLEVGKNGGCSDYSGIRCEDTSNPSYAHITGTHFSVYMQ